MARDTSVNLITLAFLLILIILGCIIVFENIRYQTFALVFPINFDGENDYVLAPMPHQLAGMKSFTLEIWLRLPDKTKPTRQNIITIGSPGKGSAIHLLLWPNLKVQYNPWGIWPEAVSKTKLSAGKWHQLVILYDGDGRVTLYIDGRVDSQFVYDSDWNLHGNISIAKCLTSSVDWFKGSIAIIRIWGRVLTKEEIPKVLNNKPPIEGLILYFRGRIENNTLIDESGENNHGEIYGVAPSCGALRSLFSKPELLVIDLYTMKLVMDPYLIIPIYMIALLMLFFTKYNAVSIYAEKQPFKIKIHFSRKDLETSIENIFAINNFSLIILLFIHVFLPSIRSFSSIMLQGAILIMFVCLSILHILKVKSKKETIE